MAALNLSHKHAAKSKSREGVKTNKMLLPNKLDRRRYLELEVRMRLEAHPLGFGATTIPALAVAAKETAEAEDSNARRRRVERG
jgi:predicted sugar kinase